MNAVTDDPALIHRDPLEGAIWVPPNLLRRNPWNRSRFDEKALADLASNVKTHGVMQPVIIRQIAGAAAGEPLYEIVAGERRWRASVMADLERMPALLRTLTDLEVVELVTIENVQREALHPLDEANNYRELAKTYGLKELADRINRSPSHVYQRLKLCELGEEGRAAMLDGHVDATTGVAIARLSDPVDQAEATAYIVKGFAGEPLSHRAALDYIQRTFQLRLEKAPFDINAAYSTVGPCGGCNKRTGANADLFGDVSKADMCQDRKCFKLKTDAAHQVDLQAAREAGHTVVTGDEARAMLPTPTSQPAGHQFLDKACSAFTDSKRPLRELLGLNFRGVVVVDEPTTQTAIAFVPDDKVKKALKAKGLLREDPKRGTVADANDALALAATAANATPTMKPAAQRPMTRAEKLRATDQLADELLCTALFRRLHVCLAADLPLLALRIALGEMLNVTSGEALGLIYEAHGWDHPGAYGFNDDLRRRIAQADAPKLGQLLVEASIAEALTEHLGYEELRDTPAAELAEHFKINLQDLRNAAEEDAEAQIQQQQAAHGAESAASPEKALTAGSKAPAKYRNAATGDTWSGRGLKPKWLTAQLAAGRTLADFTTSVPTA